MIENIRRDLCKNMYFFHPEWNEGSASFYSQSRFLLSSEWQKRTFLNISEVSEYLLKGLHNFRKILLHESLPPNGFMSTQYIILCIDKQNLTNTSLIINKSNVSISRSFWGFSCSDYRKITLYNMPCSWCIDYLCCISSSQTINSL